MPATDAQCDSDSPLTSCEYGVGERHAAGFRTTVCSCMTERVTQPGNGKERAGNFYKKNFLHHQPLTGFSFSLAKESS